MTARARTRRIVSPRWPAILSLTLLSALIASPAIGQATKLIRDDWEKTLIGGEPAGHTHRVVESFEEGGRTYFRFTEDSVIEFKRFGQTTKISARTVTTEDADGTVISIVSEADLGAGMNRSETVIQGDRRTIKETAAGQAREREDSWDPACRGSYFIERELVKSGLEPGSELSFRVFLSDFGQAGTVTFKIIGKETVDVAGTPTELVRADVTTDALPGTVQKMWLDARGVARRTETAIMGMEFTVYSADKETALAASTDGASRPDVIMTAATQLDVMLPHPYVLDEVVYRIAPKTDAIELPDFGDGRQVVEPDPNDESAIVLRALKRVPPAGARQRRPLENPPPELAPYLEASSLVQSDDPAIQRAAAQAVGETTNAWEAAVKLERWVFEHIADKNMGVAFGTASEVLASGSGDCSEHSMLLAAVARAAGIPTRASIGWLYLGSTLAPHMWCDVFIDGEWYALDATLGNGFAGGSHVSVIKSSYADSDTGQAFGKLMQVLGNLDATVLRYRLGDKTVVIDPEVPAYTIENDDTYRHRVLTFAVQKPAGWEWDRPSKPHSTELIEIELDDPDVEVKIEANAATYDTTLEALPEQMKAAGLDATWRTLTVDGRPAREMLIAPSGHTTLIVFLLHEDMLVTFKTRVRDDVGVDTARAEMARVLAGVSFSPPAGGGR